MTKEQATRKALELALTHLTNPMALQMSRDQIVAHIKEALAVDNQQLTTETQQSNEQVEPAKQLAQESFIQLWQSYCDKKMEVEDLKEQLKVLQSNEQVEPVAEVAGTPSNAYIKFLPAAIGLNIGVKLYTHPPVPTAQPKESEQEPVEMYRNKCSDGSRCLHGCHTNEPCYTTPPPVTESHKRKPLTHEQRFDLLTKFEPHKNKWEAPAILIDMVEAAHGIKENK